MIMDHLHVDIIIDPKKRTIITYPKQNLSEDAYEHKNAFFSKLSSDGVILRDSIQAGNVFGSMQAIYPESSNEETNSFACCSSFYKKLYERRNGIYANGKRL
jgi:hypothetical protein